MTYIRLDDYIITENTDSMPPGPHWIEVTDTSDPGVRKFIPGRLEGPSGLIDVAGLMDTTPGRPIMVTWRSDKPGWVEYSMATEPHTPITWRDRLLDTTALVVIGTSSVVGLALLAYQWLMGGAR